MIKTGLIEDQTSSEWCHFQPISHCLIRLYIIMTKLSQKLSTFDKKKNNCWFSLLSVRICCFSVSFMIINEVFEKKKQFHFME